MATIRIYPSDGRASYDAEVITGAEALERIGLGDIATDADRRGLVVWAGYPRPFACGNTRVRGYGPLDREAENDRDGKGRRYQQLHRTNQRHCSGEVLFSFAGVGGKPENHFLINTSLVVSLDRLPDDSHSLAMRTGWTG